MNPEQNSKSGRPEEEPVVQDPLGAPAPGPARASRSKTKLVPVALGGVVVVLVASLGLLVLRAEAQTNKVALASAPKPVSAVAAAAKPYQPTRTYVGTFEPWLAASIGPQLVSAYVDTVLVRPGAQVKRGDVLATLDCRDASAATQAVAAEARAISARQKALASEAARVQELLSGKFVSPNEAEQKSAQSDAEAAQLEAMTAKLARNNLEVNDCVLRAPFDGEIATRTIDPGAFVRPGVAIVSIVDRSTVRFTADAPEVDFDVIAPGKKVKVSLLATKRELSGTIARRAPAADLATRTVRFEVDLDDANREIPVGTTGEVSIDVGEPEPSSELPLYAASVRGKNAKVFVVEGDVAHARTVPVKGEAAGSLYVAPDLKPGTLVVTEGRALLAEGDRVSVKVEESAPAARPAESAATPPLLPVKTTASPAPEGFKR